MARLDALQGYRAELVAAGQQCASGQRTLVRAAVALDVSGEWAFDHAPTCAHWIAKALDVEVSTAREWLRVGHALAKLEVVNAAFLDGRLSYSKVRALTRVATPDNERELFEIARHVPAGRLGVALAAWLAKHEPPKDRQRRLYEARSCRFRTEPDGMVLLQVALPPEGAAVACARIDAEVRRAAQRGRDASADASSPRNEDGRWPSLAQQRADAFVRIMAGGGSAATLTEVVLHVRGDGCSLDDGTPIAGSVVERIAPASFLRVLLHDAERRPINASGRHRHPTDRQKRVVHERDRVCVDCGGTDLLECDHDPAFEESRRTIVDELRLRCASCHHARHRPNTGDGSDQGVSAPD